MSDETVTAVVEGQEDEAAEFEARMIRFNQERGLELRRAACNLIDTIERKMKCTLPTQMKERMREAAARFEDGRFFLDRTGGTTGLDPEMSAVLVHLRKELLKQIEKPTVQDILAVDIAVSAYREYLRFTSRLENMTLTLEREIFMEEGLAELHGPEKADRIFQRIALVETKVNKAIDQVVARMFKALDRLPSDCKEAAATPLIGRAGQVNIGSQVLNEKA